MKKSTRKLVVHSDTIRMLRVLSEVALGRIRAGVEPTVSVSTTNTQTGINCPAQAIVDATDS